MKKALYFLLFIPFFASAMHEACFEGDLEKVKELLSNDKSLVNAHKDNYSPPLHCAAFSGSAGIIELLLDNGAALDEVDQDGNTPLHLIFPGNASCRLSFLVRAGILRGPNRTPTGPDATQYKKAISVLIQRGASTNKCNKRGLDWRAISEKGCQIVDEKLQQHVQQEIDMRGSSDNNKEEGT